MRSLAPLLVLAPLVLHGCKKDKDDGTPPVSTGDTGPADTDTDTDADADADADADTDTDTDTDPGTDGYIRLVHAAPSLPPMAVYAPPSPTPLMSGMPPLTGSGWGIVAAGTRSLAVGPTGGGPADMWAEHTIDVVAGTRYSMVLMGSEGNVMVAHAEEDLAGIPVGEVRLMVWNAGEALGAFDVIDNDTGTPLATGVAYGAGPTVVPAPAGDLDMAIDLDRDGAGDVSFTAPGVGDQVTVPLYFLVDGGDLVMLGHAPLGAYVVERAALPPEAGETGDTGSVSPTGDTGSVSPTGHTGIAHTGQPDTSDTGY
jgi:hypothetical protein